MFRDKFIIDMIVSIRVYYILASSTVGRMVAWSDEQYDEVKRRLRKLVLLPHYTKWRNVTRF